MHHDFLEGPILLIKASEPSWGRASMLLPRIFLSFLLLFAACLDDVVLAYTLLSDKTLKNLPAPGADFDIHDGALLAPLLIPRVPGTPGSETARQHLVDFFSTYLPKWTIEYQNSTSKTPVTGDKDVPFVNLIMTRDPPWTKPGEVGRLNLAAHYDSKITPEGFIGATDSAAPCAMILHVARGVDEALTHRWAAMEAAGVGDGLEEEQGLQVIFLDGEEAFLSWTDEDSLYGARYVTSIMGSTGNHLKHYRSLAETWEQTPNPTLSTYRTPLSSISLLLLLDLLGAPNPNIISYFSTTHWAYQHMATVESRLRDLSILRSKPGRQFLSDSNKPMHIFGNFIQDDHVPFMARGVEVLHIIPNPFPRVWHRMEDDGEHLDSDTTDDWAVIITAFVAEWMDLEGYLPPASESQTHVVSKKIKSKTEL